jgi:subtilisin-like proprotein convertase family protein/threonine dehydrogenase-like Zn-dependent dehydrogenase
MKQFSSLSTRRLTRYAVRLLIALVVGAASLMGGNGDLRAQDTSIARSTTQRTPFSDTNYPCSTPLVYTLNFSEDFAISKVEFEFVATHTYRGDVRVTLISPAGTSVNVIDRVGGGTDNFNVRLADDASGSIDNGIQDDVDSSTRRFVKPSNLLSPFVGQNAQGAWRVQICDGAGSDSGETRLSLVRLFGTHIKRVLPFGYWPLDEGSGTTTADLSASARTGTLRNGPTWTTEKPSAIRFANPQALYFDGVNDYVEVSMPNDLPFNSFTVAFWARRETTGRSDFIIGRGIASTNEGLHIGFRNTNEFTCGFWGENDLNASSGFTDTNWHHWACTYNHETNRREIYRDGVLVAQDTAANDYLGRTGNLVIGRILPDRSDYFKGWVDDVRIYLRPMAAGEVSNLASGVVGACHARLPDGTVFSSTPMTPFALQDAVDAAPHGATVKVAGTCTGVHERDYDVQLLHVANKSITLEGGYSPSNWDTPDPRANPTTLDALNQGRIMMLKSYTFEFRNLTMKNGGAPYGTAGAAGSTNNPHGQTGATGGHGGGIYLTGGTLTLRNSTLSNNRAGNGGDGGQALSTSAGNGGYGGEGGHGGAIYSNGGTVRLFGVTVSENAAGNGGGGGTSPYGTGGRGGLGGFGSAIFNNVGILQITNSTIAANATGYGGGGGWGYYSGGNGSTAGYGVIYTSYYYSINNTSIVHSTIADNRTGSPGSGGYAYYYGTYASSGGQGYGGVYRSSGSLTLNHTILSNNAVSNCAGSVTADAYNMATDSTCGSARVVSTSSLYLGALANNGGPTQTMLPLPNSPAIDAGDPYFTDATALDQRGRLRLSNGRLDIGAVELNQTCFTIPNNGTTIYRSEDSAAVQAAINAVGAGGTVKIAGVCTGTGSVVASVTKNVTLAGGWNNTFTSYDPKAQTTVLDAAGRGFVLYLGGSARVQVTDLTLTGGNGVGNGGGIYVESGVTASLLRTQVISNTAGSYGGGIFNIGTLSLTQSSVLSNTSVSHGGGIYNSNGVLTLTDSTVAGNSTTGGGGGLYIYSGNVVLQRTSIHNNQARYGGGVYQSSSTLSAINTTVSSNLASTGGGFEFGGGITSADLRFVTIANNSAPSGASIWNSSSSSKVSLSASILTVAPDQRNCSGSLTSNGGYNRISDLSCNLQDATASDLQNVGNIQIEPLGDNGGPTLSHKPAPDLSIVDIMPGNICQSILGDAGLNDQRGRVRPSQGIREEGVIVESDQWTCDVGAVELGSEQQRVCGAPLLLGYVSGTPQFSNPLRCDVTTIAEALDRVQTGDTIIVSGVVTESVVVNKSVTIRGPLFAESTPGTHMGFVQGQLLPPTGADVPTPTLAPFGYWPLDEGSGTTTADLWSSARTGTLRNGPTWSTEKPTTIQFGNSHSLYFDGVDDHVEVSMPNDAINSFTVAFWAKRETTGRKDFMIGQGSASANRGLHMGFRSTNVFTCSFYANDLDTPAYTDTNWHHWACTYNHETNQRRIYRDGVLVAQDTSPSDYLGTSGTLVIGRVLPLVSEFYKGWVDDVRIYMSDLTDGEVGTLATGLAPGASTANGGIFQIEAGREVKIEQLNLRHGSAARGGAIDNAGNLTLDGVTIDNSRAFNGGAIYNAGSLQIVNSTIVSNTASSGGVIHNSADATLGIRHATIAGNSGVIIHNESDDAVTVASSLVSAPAASQCVGTITPVDGNLAHNNTCLPDAADADPLLGGLRDNGGPTLTLAIGDDSPAVNSTSCTTGVDQRGRERAGGATCDAGAVEYAPATLTVCASCVADPGLRRFTDLQAALNVAMAGDEIAIEAGEYSGNFIIYKDVTLRHAGIDVNAVSREESIDVRAILQGSTRTLSEQQRLQTPAGTVLNISSFDTSPSSGTIRPGGDVNVVLRGLTVRRGMSRQGSGIYNRGNLTLYDSTIEGNVAINGWANVDQGTVTSGQEGRGGAIYSSGTLALYRSTVSGNQSEYYGGSLYISGSANQRATALIEASTIAENRAERLSRQHVMVIDNDILVSGAVRFINPITQMLSGDEILFQNKLPFAIQLIINDSGCNYATLNLKPASLNTERLICSTAGSNRTVTIRADGLGQVQASITVKALGFTPRGQGIYANDYSDVTVRASILDNLEGSGANCAGSANGTSWTLRSGNYNLVSDRSCGFVESNDLRPASGQTLPAQLGPLQDNNIIDFQARTISGYAHTHALLPNSPAIDQISLDVCQAANQQTINLTGGNLNHEIEAGDTILWSSNAGAIVMLNDGYADARQVALVAGGGQFVSPAVQFNTAGVFTYRAYATANRQAIATGTITVTNRTRSTDQRGVALPQRGMKNRYFCDIGAYEFQTWTVGQPLPRPPIAVGTQAPRWTLGTSQLDTNSPPYHIWSAATAQNFPLQPSPNNGNADVEPNEILSVSWKTSTEPTSQESIQQAGIVVWPDDPQLHISGAPVYLAHNLVSDGFLVSSARAFEGLSPADDAAGTIYNSNIFNRTELLNVQGDSYSVLVLGRGNQANATVKVKVIKTIDWNLTGVRDVSAAATACTIGTVLDHPFVDVGGAVVGHSDPEGRSGYILSGKAFDGVMKAAELPVTQNTVDNLVPPAHVRETREGYITPVLSVAPTFTDNDTLNGNHDLRVAWYRTDERNVAWPVKSVGYRCLWPTNPQQIVIASELGSEIGAQPVLNPELYASPTIYHQPDTNLPGYNPNDEHALLAASNLGNKEPALYALRTDLTPQPYALLKYRDPREENRIKIAVYQVKITQAPQSITNTSLQPGTVTLLAGAGGESRAARTVGATDAPPLTLRVGSGDLPVGGVVRVPVEALGVKNLHSMTLRVRYDPSILQPTACATNRQDFVEAPFGLEIQTDGPVRPLRVIRMQAVLSAGTDVQYLWEFGDGSTRIAGPSVSHVYGTAGTYTVKVTASTSGFSALTATTTVSVAADALPGRLSPPSATGCRIEPDGSINALVLTLRARNKHGVGGSLTLSDITFRGVGDAPETDTPRDLTLAATSLLGPDYQSLRYDVVAGNPLFAPTPVRNLLDIQPCQQTKAADVTAKPFWKDFKGALWARAAGQMNILYYYPVQPGFFFTDAQATAAGLGTLTAAQRIGHCVPWLSNASGTIADGNMNVYPVSYNVSWPPLPALLTVGETVYERSKNGISGVATQLAVSKIYDDEAPGMWNDTQQKIVITGSQTVRSVAELIDPMSEVRVPLGITVNGNHSLPTTIKSERLLFGGGQSILSTTDYEVTLPFALRSRILYDDLRGELIFRGYYDGASPAYIKGDPLLLFNVMSAADKTRLRLLCEDDQGQVRPSSEPARTQCTTYLTAIDALYHKTRNPRGLDLCRTADGKLFADDPKPVANHGTRNDTLSAACPSGTHRDGKADQAFLIDVQDANNDGLPEPFEGLGKGKALTAGNADGTGYVTLVYNNDPSLGGLPVSLQVIQVGCTVDSEGIDSTYRGNLLVIDSDNLFDEKLTLRHTGDFGGQPDNFTFEWYIAEVDETAVSPTVLPPTYPWRPWTKIEPGATRLESEITIEGANPTTLADNWLIMRYSGYAACGNQYRYSAFAGDPSAKPSEVRAQFAPGWIKRVTSGLNPFDARVDDFVSVPVNTTIDMIQQAGKRYEGPVAMSSDPEVLNSIGLIEGYQTVLERGRSLSIDSNINSQGANAALLNVTSRIANLYMLLAGDAYIDSLDPTVALGTNSVVGARATSLFAFMNQFRPDLFGPIDEELALLRGRDETLGGVAAGPTYNRLTWNFTNGDGEVAYVQNYNVKDYNQDGFVNEADAALMYPQGHGDAWGHYLTALKNYYRLLRHPSYTWIPRAEPIGVAGAPVVVDYYDEQRFAAAAAAKAKIGAEIVNLAYRKHYADPQNQELIDSKVDPSDNTKRAWGVVDWAQRAGQGAYFDWLVANAMVPAEDDRYTDVRKIDRSTVGALGEIPAHYAAIQQQLDNADSSVNPLGLVGNAMLFDIDPALSGDGMTHFEQIYQRAITHLDITADFFNYANEMKIAQRESQNEQWDFIQSIVDQDRALISELIELFGYPYDADIGVNGTYPAGYTGPDIYNYDLWDRIDLTDHQKRCSEAAANDPLRCPPQTTTKLIEYGPLPCIGFAVTGVDPTRICKPLSVDSLVMTKTIEYVVGIGLDAGRGRFKPSSWPESSARKAPGDIQNAIQALNQARNEYEQAILAYQDGVAQLEEYQVAYNARADYVASKRDLLVGEKATSITLGGVIMAAKIVARAMDTYGTTVDDLSEDTSECIPDVIGFSNSFGAPVGCALRIVGTTLSTVAQGVKFAAETSIDVLEFSNETVQNSIAIADFDEDADYELKQMAMEIYGLLRQEQQLRLALILAKDKVNSAQGDYDQVLQRGFRMLQELIRLRQRWAGQITEQRYGDMAFRIFQNDALQNYRRQYDLTQKYVFLTAAAYDYETNLALGDPATGNHFLRQIVGVRSLGLLNRQERPDGTVIPLTGSGLADPMARMAENFVVLKGQLGINNPQVENNRFSLRHELFRLGDDSDAKWQQTLLRYYTPNIFANDEVAQLAKRPFGESGAQPGLIIPFSSNIIEGLNFFGQPLGPTDSAYDASQFSTKIAGVGVWFENYDISRLAQTPRVYLLPAGRDVIRPRDTNGRLRYWDIVEQLLPLPHVLNPADASNATWIPRIDGLAGQMYEVRSHARFRAYPYTEDFDPSEMVTDTRLIGRSVWNTEWLLVIPASALLADPQIGLDRFIEDVTDIYINFDTYSYAGTR